MFAHAHVFVRLHSRMQDGDHVAVMTVDPSGDAILITVMSRECKTYEARIDAEEMKGLVPSIVLLSFSGALASSKKKKNAPPASVLALL